MIEELPVEILVKILSYLPNYEKVSLVNKHFYAVVSTQINQQICLDLDAFLFVNAKFFVSLRFFNLSNFILIGTKREPANIAKYRKHYEKSNQH